MGFPELERWHLASLAAALPVLGCNSSDDGFRITSLAYDDQDRLVLTFSEPIVDPSDVDPADFRLSLARTSQFLVPGMQAQEWTYYSHSSMFSAVAPGSVSNQLVLTPSSDVDFASDCQAIETYIDDFEEYVVSYYEQQYPGSTMSFDLALFLHYAAGDIPIASERGETIPDVAPDFVLTNDDYLSEMRFGFLNYLRIPCP